MRTQLAIIALTIICIIGVCSILIWGKAVLCPLICALLLSIALLPVANFFEKRLHLWRGFSSFLTVLLFFGLVAAIIFIISKQVAVIDWKNFAAQVSKSFDGVADWGRRNYNIDMQVQLNQAKQSVLTSGSKMATVTIISFSSFLIFIVFLVFYTFFLLLYRRRMISFLLSLVREENRAALTNIVNRIQLTVRNYLIGISLEMLIVSVCSCIAFKLIGIPYFMFMGILTGVFNIIPYAGILTALAINIIITFGAVGVTKILWLVLATGAIHLVDSNLILPFVVGAKVRINAFVVVVGLALGEMIWGIPGMFLATPLIGVIKIISDHVHGFKPLAILLGAEKNTAANQG